MYDKLHPSFTTISIQLDFYKTKRNKYIVWLFFLSQLQTINGHSYERHDSQNSQ